MAKKYVPRDYMAVLEEALGQNDRAAISAGTSLVDFALERYIASRLRPPSKKDLGRLFTESGIFGSFSQRILGAYFMRLIGPITRGNLDLIREVRNQVSHDMNPVSFQDTSCIKSRCLQIDRQHFGPDMQGTSPGAVFKVAIQVYMASLLMRAGDPTPTERPHNTSAPRLDL
jgi:hypothetical protein